MGIKIKPVALGLPTMECTEIMIRPIIADTQALSCTTYYEVSSLTGGIGASGNVPITEEEYAAWGEQNGYIEDIVISRLGLERDDEIL